MSLWMRGRFVCLAFLALGFPTPAAGFDGSRAFADLASLVRLGPRLPGSQASALARDLIKERLRQAGWVPEVQTAAARLGDRGEVAVVNIWARKEQPEKPIVILVAHYDTKQLSSRFSPGANDGASGVALLLELARSLPRGVSDTEVWLAFCDASKPLGSRVSTDDGLHGSRAFARSVEAAGQFPRLAAVLFVDRVADRELEISPGIASSARLARKLLRASLALDEPKLVEIDADFSIDGDHQAFRERGVVEVLAVVDNRFGSGVAPGDLYESPQDDLSNVSSESLARAGALVQRFLIDFRP